MAAQLDDEPLQVPQKRKLIIHNGDNQWNLKVYTGTPVEDIKATIRDLIKIDDFICMDDDGDVLVLSSSLPSGIHIYIQEVEPGDTTSAAASTTSGTSSKTGLLCWNHLSVHSNMPINHMISNNNLSFEETSNTGWGRVVANIPFKSGIHCYKLSYEKGMCCCYDSFSCVDAVKYEARSKTKPDKLRHLETGATYGLYGSCPECDVRHGLRNLPGYTYLIGQCITFLFVVDMEKRNIWVYKEGYGDDPLACYTDLPVGGIYVSQGIKHQLKVTMEPLEKVPKEYTLKTGKYTVTRAVRADED